MVSPLQNGKKNTERQIKGLELIFVELPKFKTTTHMEKKLGILWFRFLNEISNMKVIPDEFTNVPEICEAIELTQEASFSKTELAEYDGYWDQISIEKTIKGDAKAKGKTEGLAEGKAEAKRDMAIEMLKENFSDDIILKLAKISLQELDQLKKSRLA